MRGPRIKEEGEAYYHMISRVVDRRMLFDTNGCGIRAMARRWADRGWRGKA